MGLAVKVGAPGHPGLQARRVPQGPHQAALSARLPGTQWPRGSAAQPGLPAEPCHPVRNVLDAAQDLSAPDRGDPRVGYATGTLTSRYELQAGWYYARLDHHARNPHSPAVNPRCTPSPNHAIKTGRPNGARFSALAPAHQAATGEAVPHFLSRATVIRVPCR